MSDYKRWISYIYNYEKNVKKNNIGYVRVETRGEMTKLTLHINVLSVVEPMSVYMIYRNAKTDLMEGIKIGLISMDRGVGHGVYSTYTKDIMETGLGINDIGGILVFHEKDRFYASEWDDVEIDIRKFAEYTMNREEPGMMEDILSMQESMEIRQEDEQPAEKEMQPQWGEPQAVQEQVQPQWGEPQAVQEQIQPQWEEPQAVQEQEQPQWEEPQAVQEQEQPQWEEPQAVQEQMQSGQEDASISQENEDITTKYLEDIENFGNVKGLFEHPENEPDIRLREAAENMLRTYPYMYPFEDDDIDACVRIEPKDIENLPMNTWIIANNSFLLKGYYGYRHLIFFKIGKDKPRYMIGVPGINHNRENFIANMFGFRLFRPIKKTREVKGEYGYWCIIVDNS